MHDPGPNAEGSPLEHPLEHADEHPPERLLDLARAAVLAAGSLALIGAEVHVRQRTPQFFDATCTLDGHAFTVQVVLDESASRVFDVAVVYGTPPAGLEVGEVTIEPSKVSVTGGTAAFTK